MSLASCSRSGAERYLCCRKRLSNSKICALEKSTLRFRFLVFGISISWSWSFSLLKSSESSLSVESARNKMEENVQNGNREWSDKTSDSGNAES